MLENMNQGGKYLRLDEGVHLSMLWKKEHEVRKDLNSCLYLENKEESSNAFYQGYDMVL